MSYSSLIKPKYGTCTMCADNRTVVLAKVLNSRTNEGLCGNHYWKGVRLKSFQKKCDNLVLEENGRTELQNWYARIMKDEKATCWNCGETAHWVKQKQYIKLWHGSICHILSKSKFPSVATHPMNYLIMFPGMSGICNCHDVFDSSALKSIQMPVLKIARYRFELFKNEIAKEEVRLIPSIFLMNENVLK